MKREIRLRNKYNKDSARLERLENNRTPNLSHRCAQRLAFEGSQMLFYVWFEFTSWLRGVGQGKGAWDCFLTIWAWDSCAFCQGDQWLLRNWTFILQMTLSWPDVDSLGLLPSALMFCLNLKKVPPPILTIKIPCKNDLRGDLRWLQITTHVIE